MKNRDIPATEEITMYLHCGKCIDEWKKTEDVSPRDFARVSIGWTKLGLQVWCNRHKCNVIHIDFEGHKHAANMLSE